MIHALKLTDKSPFDLVPRIAKKIIEGNPNDSVVVIPENVEFFYNYPMERLIEYRDKLTEIIEGRMYESKV